MTLDLVRSADEQQARWLPGAVAGARWMHGVTALPDHSTAIRQSWPTPEGVRPRPFGGRVMQVVTMLMQGGTQRVIIRVRPEIRAEHSIRIL